VNPGEVIEANKELMRVTDLSTVWVVGQVYEKDLATVRVGSGANVTSDAYPGRVFRGRVSYVDPKIDPATRNTVMEGIKVGDRIVSQGSFLLRAEWLKTHSDQ
jgi:multidrug resistance efflux pump